MQISAEIHNENFKIFQEKKIIFHIISKKINLKKFKNLTFGTDFGVLQKAEIDLALSHLELITLDKFSPRIFIRSPDWSVTFSLILYFSFLKFY